MDKTVFVTDMEKETVIKKYNFESQVTCLTFDSEGIYVYCGLIDGRLCRLSVSVNKHNQISNNDRNEVEIEKEEKFWFEEKH